MATLLLIDGLSLAYRAFYALPSDLATAAGTITNAVYGFTSMLVKVLGDEHPDGIAVVFDAPGPTFRNDLDANYKGNRKETPDIFVPQIPLIHEVIDALHIPTLQLPGVEADDVIATLAARAAADGIDVIIVTGDRDSYQLVSDPHVKVLYNRRGVSDYVLYDEAGIFERTGVTPAQYPEYAALRGDPSDNLPGVPGVGEKTAAKLISTYGNLEGIYEHLDDLPPKQRQNLGEARDRVFLNRQMSQLRLDCDVDAVPAELRMGAWDRDEVRVLFDQLEFRTLLPRLLEAIGDASAADVEAATVDVEVTVARDAMAVLELLGTLAERDEPYAVEARWEGAPGTSPLRAVAIASDDATATYIDAALLARRGGPRGAESPRRRRRSRPHRAPGQGPHPRARRRRPLAPPRHRGDGVPARPGPGEVPARRTRAPVPRVGGAIARRGGGNPRPRRRQRDRPDGPPRRGDPAAGGGVRAGARSA